MMCPIGTPTLEGSHMIRRPAPEISPLVEFSPQTLVRSIIATSQAPGAAASDVVRRNWPEVKQTLAWMQRGVSQARRRRIFRRPPSSTPWCRCWVRCQP